MKKIIVKETNKQTDDPLDTLRSLIVSTFFCSAGRQLTSALLSFSTYDNWL